MLYRTLSNCSDTESWSSTASLKQPLTPSLADLASDPTPMMRSEEKAHSSLKSPTATSTPTVPIKIGKTIATQSLELSQKSPLVGPESDSVIPSDEKAHSSLKPLTATSTPTVPIHKIAAVSSSESWTSTKSSELSQKSPFVKETSITGAPLSSVDAAPSDDLIDIFPKPTTNGKDQCGFNALFQSLFAIPEFCAAVQSCSDPAPLIQLIKERHDAMFSTETSILDVGTESYWLGEKQSFRKALASTLLEAQTDGNLKFKDMYSSLVLESTGRSTDVITECIEGLSTDGKYIDETLIMLLISIIKKYPLISAFEIIKGNITPDQARRCKAVLCYTSRHFLTISRWGEHIVKVYDCTRPGWTASDDTWSALMQNKDGAISHPTISDELSSAQLRPLIYFLSCK